jgi:hypothetical protein
MHRQGSGLARRAAVLGALLAIALVPAAASANAHAISPGHIRGIVFAKTKQGRALHQKLVNRGKAPGLGGLLGGNNLQYNGGPVMHSDGNYVIYWEPSGYSTTSAYKNILSTYFTNVAAASGATTNDYSVATQYSDGSGKIAYSASSGGSTVDTNSYPASGCVSTAGGPCISDAQLQTEISKVVAANGWPKGLATMYFVYFPPGVTTCTDVTSTECSGTVYCAYHSSMGSGSSTILYANMPYDGISGCDSGEHPNGNAGADDELNVTSHENIEAITDPLGTAWYDSSGQEIGDKCNFNFGSPLGGAAGAEYNEQISSGNYWLQQEWSNASSGCVQRM